MALDLESLSVSEIRKLLALNNVDTRGCVEKVEIPLFRTGSLR